ncbi:MAG: CDP-archaeol synthase [Cellvibrionaceae bacterium]
MLTIQIALLLIVANGSPLLVGNLLGRIADRPIDADLCFVDGQPLLGATKTWRGLLSSLLLTSLCAWLLGLGWLAGLVVAGGAMLGDLISSFIKRRLGMASSTKAIGLDQLPEALIPALLVHFFFHYSWSTVIIATGVFVIADMLVSPLLFRWGLRREPH